SRRNALLLVLVAPLIYGAVLGAILVSWGTRDRAQKADAIVIFGARVNKSGQASLLLRARTHHAFELWQRGLAPVIVCTGGIGDFPPAEAAAQAALLQKWGVPATAILREETSTSTRENARNAAALLPHGAKIIAVSQPFHLWRCRRDCARFGLTALSSPEMQGWIVLRPHKRALYALREAAAVTWI
ncbi:MAG: YdcF family protein, partial [Armatimonadetes bacterium]|nr:YdcF family protein [Armatimonadota bacterium]